MRTLMLVLALAASAAGSAAFAQAAALKAGTMLVASDGKRIGRIERIVNDKSGQPQSASVIYNSKVVYVPVSTVTMGEDGRATTSLSRKEVASR